MSQMQGGKIRNVTFTALTSKVLLEQGLGRRQAPKNGLSKKSRLLAQASDGF
jgi:hypothetical protein